MGSAGATASAGSSARASATDIPGRMPAWRAAWSTAAIRRPPRPGAAVASARPMNPCPGFSDGLAPVDGGSTRRKRSVAKRGNHTETMRFMAPIQQPGGRGRASAALQLDPPADPAGNTPSIGDTGCGSYRPTGGRQTSSGLSGRVSGGGTQQQPGHAAGFRRQLQAAQRDRCGRGEFTQHRRHGAAAQAFLHCPQHVGFVSPTHHQQTAGIEAEPAEPWSVQFGGAEAAAAPAPDDGPAPVFLADAGIRRVSRKVAKPAAAVLDGEVPEGKVSGGEASGSAAAMTSCRRALGRPPPGRTVSIASMPTSTTADDGAAPVPPTCAMRARSQASRA